jgi:hypothetical protein
MAPTNNGKSAFLVHPIFGGREGGDEDELSSFRERVQMGRSVRDMAMAMRMVGTREDRDGTQSLARKKIMARTRTIGAVGIASAGSTRAYLCVRVQRRTRRIKTAYSTT